MNTDQLEKDLIGQNHTEKQTISIMILASCSKVGNIQYLIGLEVRGI